MAQVPPAPRGRRRSESAHQAVLRAASELLRERGYAGLTIEAIAARAGVGKQTIYRWWPSKGAVVLDAFRNDLAADPPPADDGDAGPDPAAQVRRMAATLTDPTFGPYIAALTCEAQLDPVFAAAFRREIVDPSREGWRAIFARARAAGEIRADVDLDLAIDLLNGPLWYRLLLRPGAMGGLDPAALCEAVLRAIRPPDRG